MFQGDAGNAEFPRQRGLDLERRGRAHFHQNPAEMAAALAPLTLQGHGELTRLQAVIAAEDFAQAALGRALLPGQQGGQFFKTVNGVMHGGTSLSVDHPADGLLAVRGRAP